jgi:3-oxoacyl-[acyl-carrier-protein] synthase II
MAVETALDAWVDAGLAGTAVYDRRRIGIANGTSQSGNPGILTYLEQKVAGELPDPTLLEESAMWVARCIAMRTNARGPNFTLHTACSSGLNSIGQMAGLLRTHRLDCALAGGADTFSFLSFAGFSSLRAIARDGCRPFDVDRDGMSLGDGAAYCVLERETDARRRGARVLAYVTGYASAGEGHHPTAPDPNGRGALQVMTKSLEQDGAPEDLAFVSAHGTGTPANDSAELHAVQEMVRRFAITRRVRVAAIKSQIGHTLGAAGAHQIVAAIACQARRLIPGTIGLRQPLAHQPPLEFPTEPLTDDAPLVLCNSFGFAGSCAALCLRPAPAGASTTAERNDT